MKAISQILKILGLAVPAFLIVVFLVIFPVVTACVYNAIFRVRFQTAPQNALSADRFPGLTVESISFPTKQGHALAGYKYRMWEASGSKGVVVVVHGFGGGGHCSHMPLVAFFASEGYDVFSYDATANDQSEGKAIGGFPQGVIDLDYALRYVKSEYPDLPIFLVGHSWGAYSVGNVLNFHTDVKGAVLFAGFDRSELMFRQEGKKYTGALTDLMMSYVRSYEQLKFGKYARVSASQGFSAAADTQIMIIHSTDDKKVLAENGYDLFYARYNGSPRIRFISYENRGHSNLFFSEETIQYRASLGDAYRSYLTQKGLPASNEAQAAFRDDSAYVDFEKCFRLDEALMAQILGMFASAVE